MNIFVRLIINKNKHKKSDYFFIQIEENLTSESPIWIDHNSKELVLEADVFVFNGFEEMIKLTHEGKLWKFPIDNEQGI